MNRSGMPLRTRTRSPSFRAKNFSTCTRFFGAHAHLAGAQAFALFLAPLRKTNWFVYAKRPFAGPKAVLAYLSRYTHRVAISNSRLIKADAASVTFKVENYRVEGPARYTTITLGTSEFIRRFLIHVLPKGFHRIRHYGLFASGAKTERIATVRKLLGMPAPGISANIDDTESTGDDHPNHDDDALTSPCPCCGGRMSIIEIFKRGESPRHRPSPRPVAIRIDTS